MKAVNIDIPIKSIGLNREDVDAHIENLLDFHQKVLNKLIREIKLLERTKENMLIELEAAKKNEPVYTEEVEMEEPVEIPRVFTSAHKRVEKTIALIEEIANQKIEQMVENAKIQMTEYDEVLEKLQQEIDENKEKTESLLGEVIHLLKTNMDEVYSDHNKQLRRVEKEEEEEENLPQAKVIDIFQNRNPEPKPTLKVAKNVEEKVLKSLVPYYHSKEEFVKYLGQLLSEDAKIVTGAVLLVEINEFIIANYLFDCASGDELIAEIIGRIKNINDNLYIARVAYDQLGIIFSGTDNIDNISKLARVILKQIKTKLSAEDKKIDLSANIGIAVYHNNNEDDAELVMNYAGIALFKAKEKGKNNLHFIDESLISEVKFTHNWRVDLAEAIENDELELYYQPQYNADDKTLVGFEGLLRWSKGDYGDVPIINTIKLAEEEGLIEKLGEIVLRKACAFAKKVNAKSPRRPLVVSVNISTTQLMRDDFVIDIGNVIAETGVPTEYLGFEVTESCFMECFEENCSKIAQIKDMGITIAIDDFGTGYSNLSYLLKMPVSVVKIDKSFLDDMTTNEKSKKFIESIITITHDLGLKVVAEGVENEQQSNMLASMSCDYLQGYYLARPLPEEQAFMYV